MEKERALKRGRPAKDFERLIASSFVGSTAARDDSRIQADSLLESLRSVLYDPPDLKIRSSSAYRGTRVDDVRCRGNHTGNIGSKEILMLKRELIILLAAVSV